MAEPRPHVLVAAVSARALAASAVRAGYRVTAVDAFGDVDLRAVAEVVPLRRDAGAPFGPVAAARAARSVAAGLAAYGASFENHPGAVAALARGRTLLGNPPAVLERVRNPIGLMRALRARGFVVPETRATPPAQDGGRWLLKPRRSGGGHGTASWRRGRPVGRGGYLQERIDGLPGSIVFAADGRRAVPLGLSRQLVGERAFGARGFRYCGSLLASVGAPLFEAQDELLARAAALASAVTAAFGLRGVNGVDFIARGGVPVPVEANPRWCASMEVVERATGASLFGIHAAACAGRLPEAALAPLAGARTHGKAVVFARRTSMAPPAAAWSGLEMADVPRAGERLEAGHAVCTVLADAAGGAACLRALAAAAQAVHRAVEPRARGAA